MTGAGGAMVAPPQQQRTAAENQALQALVNVRN